MSGYNVKYYWHTCAIVVTILFIFSIIRYGSDYSYPVKIREHASLLRQRWLVFGTAFQDIVENVNGKDEDAGITLKFNDVESTMMKKDVTTLVEKPPVFNLEQRETILRLSEPQISFPHCSELFSQYVDANVSEAAKSWLPEDALPDVTLSTVNCTGFKDHYFFSNSAMSEEEADYAIAYVVMVHTDADQVARLLQAIYWPQNVYCIHIDADSDPPFIAAMRNIVECLPSNVFIASRLEVVEWAEIGVLKGTMNCLTDLIARPEPWNYVLLYSGTDFPLKTNWELVQILKVLNGSQDSSLALEQNDRWIHYHVRNDQTGLHDKVPRVHRVPPFGLTVYKGMYQVTLSRAFVEFTVSDEKPRAYLEWLDGSVVPDEVFFGTLIHNLHLGAPGSFPGTCFYYYEDAATTKPWISRYQVWYSNEYDCHSERFTKESCVFGVADLPYLINRVELTAHKFYSDFQPATLRCLAERHFNRTYAFSTTEETFNIEFYQNMPSVRYHKMREDEKLKFTCH